MRSRSLCRSHGLALLIAGLLPGLLAAPVEAQMPPAAATKKINAAARRLTPAKLHGLSVRWLASGEELVARDATRARRIASVSKIFTAATAMLRLGPDYRFRTAFYADGVVGPSVGKLYVQGFGDPMLISEEWRDIAAALPVLEIRDEIVVDDSYFAPGLELIREEGVSNPYNARNAAFATNFNTIEVTLRGNQVKGEPQTPLTPFTVFQLKPTRRGHLYVDTRQGEQHLRVQIKGPFKTRSRRLRFHLGHDPRTPALYAGHLFGTIFTQGGGVRGKAEVQRGAVPADAQLVYLHESSRDLAQISAELFEYSNNFVANQVFLVLGAEALGPPAQVEKSRTLLAQDVAALIGPGQVNLVEGSGLDPRNTASASAVTRYLAEVAPRLPRFAGLMSARLDGRVRVKTGTYAEEGVRAMAGYLVGPGDQPYAAFALLCDGQRCPRNSFKRYDRLLAALVEALPPPALEDGGATATGDGGAKK